MELGIFSLVIPTNNNQFFENLVVTGGLSGLKLFKMMSRLKICWFTFVNGVGTSAPLSQQLQGITWKRMRCGQG